MENYVKLSLETHLFFSRIMKEHALFLEAGFPCVNEAWIQKADWFRKQFENLLFEVVRIGNQRISCPILKSNELVTEFTIPAEKRTQHLSGISINSRISMMEQRLQPESCMEKSCQLNSMIHQINEHAICLLNGFINFKENILEEVLCGRIFNVNYPLLIKHILREAKLYRATLEELMQNKQVCYRNLCETENFWNRIMMEHALFIRGLLDPSEVKLIDTANEFASEYKELLEMANCQDYRAMEALRKESLAETLQYRDFKATGTAGILDCKIASIILPLLADHVLREANHYIRILECKHMD